MDSLDPWCWRRQVVVGVAFVVFLAALLGLPGLLFAAALWLAGWLLDVELDVWPVVKAGLGLWWFGVLLWAIGEDLARWRRRRRRGLRR